MNELDPKDSCPSCGKWTSEGERKWRERCSAKPIYGTDFSKPLPVLIEEARHSIVKVRGELSDISFKHPGWGERIKEVEGLLTCGLIALAYVRTEMEKVLITTTDAATAREGK